MTRQPKFGAVLPADSPDASATSEENRPAGAYLCQATRQMILRRVAAFVGAWTGQLSRAACEPDMRDDRSRPMPDACSSKATPW
jgi:hypothetical protein